MNFRQIFLNLQSFIFIASQLTVGVLNYLFQIYANHSLDLIEFGSWSQWLAQFSVACFAGVWIQYLSSIGGLENKLNLSKSRWLLLFLLLGLFLSFYLNSNHLMFALGWFGSLLNGYWIGSHLRQKKMQILAFATIAGTLSKFLWVYFDSSSQNFYHGVSISALLVCAFLLLFPTTTSTEGRGASSLNPQLLLGSLSLAFFSSWVPQMDLLVAPHLISDLELGQLARVALLYKGFYFGFQILSQILLSHQVQAHGLRLQLKHLLQLGGLGLAAVAFAALFGSWMLWPPLWGPLSLLHITSLCLVFLIIQERAAQHQALWPIGLCVFSLLLAALGTLSKVNLETYWTLSAIAELLIVLIFALRPLKNPDLTKF